MKNMAKNADFFGNSPLGLHFADFANLGRFADFSPVSHPKFAKNHESQTENPSVVDSARYAQNLGENSAKIAESSADFAKLQNLNENNHARSAHLKSCPLRGAKNRIQGCSSATADFLLEAESRVSPPKSEKRQLLGTHFKKVGGSGAGGAALLRKESSEISGEGFAESIRDFALTSLPQNNNLSRFAESSEKDCKHFHTKIKG